MGEHLSNVELLTAVSDIIIIYLCTQPDTNISKRLALGLVDGCCEGGFHRKLSSVPLESELTNLRYEGDSGNQYSPLIANNFALK